MDALTNKKEAERKKVEDLKDNRPLVQDFSDDNSEADVDIAYIKEMNLHFEKELLEFQQPVNFTFRRKQNSEETASKVVIDIYLSTSTERPSRKNHMMHRRLKFGYKTANNLENTSATLG